MKLFIGILAFLAFFKGVAQEAEQKALLFFAENIQQELQPGKIKFSGYTESKIKESLFDDAGCAADIKDAIIKKGTGTPGKIKIDRSPLDKTAYNAKGETVTLRVYNAVQFSGGKIVVITVTKKNAYIYRYFFIYDENLEMKTRCETKYLI